MAAGDPLVRVNDRTGYRAVVFDAGNTLIYISTRPAEILRDLCGQMGFSITLERAQEACAQSERFFAAHYLTHRGDQNRFWNRYHGAALEYLGVPDVTGERAALLSHGFSESEEWSAFPESASVCRALRSLGLKLGVVSNGPLEVSDLLSGAGLRDFFDVVLTSQQAGVEKPDPRIFHACLAALGVPAGECLFVGDLYDVDVVGARGAGMDAVLIDRGGVGGARDCPVIRNLNELFPLL